MPEKEWPTRTVGPSCRASTRLADATASGSVVNGFCTEVTLRPAVCNRGMTSLQQEPSAKSPCTSTTLLAFVEGGFAAIARGEIRVVAAPATRPAEKARLSIVTISLRSCLRSPAHVPNIASTTDGHRSQLVLFKKTIR